MSLNTRITTDAKSGPGNGNTNASIIVIRNIRGIEVRVSTSDHLKGNIRIVLDCRAELFERIG
jgi:hypothetical protein